MPSGRLFDYLGQGIAADRPVAPDITADGIGLYYATDTEVLSFFGGSPQAWENVPLGTLSSDFITLTDTPADYVGHAAKLVVVNGTEDGLEFSTAPSVVTEEIVEDWIAGAMTAGTGITVTYDDGAGTITIDCGITQYTDEMARDAIGTAIVGANGVDSTVNDGADTITLSLNVEFIQDLIAAFMVAGSGITLTYNDGANSLTVVLNLTSGDVTTALGYTPLKAGRHTIDIMAGAMTSRTTAGAEAAVSESVTNKLMIASMNFDQTTQEHVQWAMRMPKSWDEGTITYDVTWTSTGTGDVIFGLQAIALSNDDVIDTAFGSAIEVTDSVTAANDLMVTAESAALTIGGSPAAMDYVQFQLYRKAADGADTLNADAKVIGVNLYINYNAADDA